MSDRHYVHHDDEVRLAKILKESKPWLEQHGTTLIYGLAAILAISAVAVFIARRPPATADASRSLLLASSPEDFQAVADEAPDSPIGVLARLKQAEFSLTNAVGNLFTNREVGLEELNTAETTYEVLASRNDLSADVRLRVLVGLARITEAKCDGTDSTTDAAIAAWEKVLNDFPDSTVFREMAETRIKRLPLEATRSFYAWFQQQNPKPGDDLQLPQDGPGKVPDIPRIDLENMLKGLTPPAGGTAPSPAESSSSPVPTTTPDPVVPAADDSPPATTPSEGTPAVPEESTPATSEEPAPSATPEGTGTPDPATDSPDAETPAPPETPEAPSGEAPESPQKSGE